MNRFINYLSILAGKRFHKAYGINANARKSDAWLNLYIGLRQMLPKEESWKGNNHMGNHFGSQRLPWKATQGI